MFLTNLFWVEKVKPYYYTGVNEHAINSTVKREFLVLIQVSFKSMEKYQVSRKLWAIGFSTDR